MIEQTYSESDTNGRFNAFLSVLLLFVRENKLPLVSIRSVRTVDSETAVGEESFYPWWKICIASA